LFYYGLKDIITGPCNWYCEGQIGCKKCDVGHLRSDSKF